MSKPISVFSSLSALVLVISSPAFAQVTAEELWSEWQDMAAVTGQSLSADVTTSPDGLILSGFETRSEQNGMITTGQIDEIRLTETGDGSVSITLSEVYRVATTIPDNATVRDGMVSVSFDMRHEGLEITASGPAEDRRYDYSADTITVTNGPIIPAGEPPADVTVVATLRDVTTTYMVSGDADEDMRFATTGGFAGLNLLVDANAPPGEVGSFKLSYDIGATTSTGSGSIASLNALQNLGGGDAGAIDLTGDASYDRMSYEMSFRDPTTEVSIDGTNAGGRIAFGLSEDTISYDLSSRDTQTRILTNEFPVPIQASIAESRFALDLPISAQPEGSAFALTVGLDGVVVSEALWGMFDPMASIPRDPASLTVDVDGTVQIFTDLLGADVADMTGPPGELRTLNVNSVNLSVGGATLDGTGALAFPEGQTIPMPVGQINLAAAGVNGLLGRLVQAGLVPMEQMAMFQGLAGMFARPGAGPDTLETTIDFLPGGGITANGIPLQ